MLLSANSARYLFFFYRTSTTSRYLSFVSHSHSAFSAKCGLPRRGAPARVLFRVTKIAGSRVKNQTVVALFNTLNGICFTTCLPYSYILYCPLSLVFLLSIIFSSVLCVPRLGFVLRHHAPPRFFDMSLAAIFFPVDASSIFHFSIERAFSFPDICASLSRYSLFYSSRFLVSSSLPRRSYIRFCSPIDHTFTIAPLVHSLCSLFHLLSSKICYRE